MGCFNVPGDAVLSPDGRTLLLASGASATAQRLRNGIRFVRGTYRFDLSKGIPWLELLEKPNQELLQATVRDYFTRHPDVSSVVSLQFRLDPQTRLLSVDYELRMADGSTLADSTDIAPLNTP